MSDGTYRSSNINSMVYSADLVVYFEWAGFGYTSIISSSLLYI